MVESICHDEVNRGIREKIVDSQRQRVSKKLVVIIEKSKEGRVDVQSTDQQRLGQASL